MSDIIPVGSPWQPMDTAPWDTVVMLRGESGYRKPHDVFCCSGYRVKDWHGGNWNDICGDHLMDAGWRPIEWRPCGLGEK